MQREDPGTLPVSSEWGLVLLPLGVGGTSGDGNQEQDRKPDSSAYEQTTQTPPESRVQNNVGKTGWTPTALPATARG